MSLFNSRSRSAAREHQSGPTKEQIAAKRKAMHERLGKPEGGGTTRTHSSQMPTKREHGEAAGDGIFSNKAKIRHAKIRAAAKGNREEKRAERKAARLARRNK